MRRASSPPQSYTLWQFMKKRSSRADQENASVQFYKAKGSKHTVLNMANEVLKKAQVMGHVFTKNKDNFKNAEALLL